MTVLAICGAVGGFVGPVIELAKLIAKPIGRQFNYICCFTTNINTLKHEAKTLEDATSDLQKRIETATNNGRVIFSQVDTTLVDSKEMQNRINGILVKAPNVGSGCLELRERYSLSKKTKKTANAIKEQVLKCKFGNSDNDISHPPQIAAIAPVQSGTTVYEFESRRQIEEEIMKALESKNVNKIGICGMGGLGKTTMAREIMNRALKEGLFEEIAFAVVSQPVNKLNIQLQIAEPLGLKFEDDTLIPRASKLRERLRGKKRTLLVLDDVWGSLDLEEMGIPCEYGCKVILTSRNIGVLSREMDVEKVCELEILDEKDAWILFRGKVGTCVDDVALTPIAKDVMGECKGLPLALDIVGKAFKNENDVSHWKVGLGQLRRANPSDIPGIVEQVYNPLKLSYDRLGNENAKTVFLLCCLFPEDCDNPLKHLAYFATGLHLFEDIEELEEVRGRTSALIKTLKTRGLLLDGSDKVHVRMHDVARDVSIFIASEERRVKCKDCTWISSFIDGGARHVPPPSSCFPELKLLFMHNEDGEQEMEINIDNLIGGSTELNVLFIEDRLMKSLPLHATQSLKISLTTLVMHDCKSLESIAIVGQLDCLEILICRSCPSVKELPKQLRGLKRLKELKISECYNLKRIAAGVISSLVGLEKLKIVKSFYSWKGRKAEVGNKVTTVAGLSEIESLKKLRCLAIQVIDIELVAQPLCLSSKLVKFKVLFGENLAGYYCLEERSYQRSIYLQLGNESDGINLGDLSKNIFLTRTEYLNARGGNQDFNLSLVSAQSIRGLTLMDFMNKKNISSVVVFSRLEFLFLCNFNNLEEMWDAPIPSNSFKNLKHLRLEGLWVLKQMGEIVLSTADDFFLQLETIQITGCVEMEHLLAMVPNEEESKENHIGTILIFPKLKYLSLGILPQLASICSSRIESIQFPLLTEMTIQCCANFKWLVLGNDDDHHYLDADGDDESLHLFCHPKVQITIYMTIYL